MVPRGSGRKPMGQRLIRIVGSMATLLLVASVTHAQTTSGSLAGIVRDTQGGAIPGVTVTLISNTRGDELPATTQEDGAFTFPQVQPGVYTLRVALGGFKTVERVNVVMNANDRLNVGIIALEVG